MLYELWRNLADSRRNELALWDASSGRRWTFGQLWTDGERRSLGGAPVIFPSGHSPEFILDLLAAWRGKRIVCPLEPGQSPPDFPPPPRCCVHLKCTSGTAGGSRMAALTAAQLAADAANIAATMELRPDWPNLGVISLAHSYGFSNLVLPLLLYGIPLILAPAPLPEIVRRAAGSQNAITLAAVPAIWRAWHDAGAIPPNVRLAISAGAPLPAPLEQAVFRQSGVKIHNFLGASECGGIAYDAGAVPRSDPMLAGAPLRNVDLSLSQDGCLVVRGSAVAESYWPEPSPALGNGIFHTSDLAELKDGAVFLRGRVGDQINVAGRKVSPDAIEQALLAHPRVRECLVFGAPTRQAERAEAIIAVVVSDAPEAELRRFLLRTLPAWQVPRHWRFVERLEASARGKRSRAAWRQEFIRSQPAGLARK